MIDIEPLLGAEKVTVLVTAIGAPPGRNVIRSLQKFANITLICGDSNELTKIHANDNHFVILPTANMGERYVKDMLEICQQFNVDVILPCIEDEVLVLSGFLNEFRKRGVQLALSPAEVIRSGIDKLEIYKTCERLNIPTILTIDLTSVAGLETVKNWKLPFIIKPKIGHGARGVELVETIEQRNRLLAKNCQGLIAQEYIAGGDGSNYMHSVIYDGQSEVVARFQSRSTSTLFDFGGPATAGESILNNELAVVGQQLENEFFGRWVGVANFEFKRCAQSGQFYFMDLNPRVWGYSSLAEDSGMDFPLMLLLVALNKPFLPKSNWLTDVQMTRQPQGHDISVLTQMQHVVNQNSNDVEKISVLICNDQYEDIESLEFYDIIWCKISTATIKNNTVFLPLPLSIAPGFTRNTELLYLATFVKRAKKYELHQNSQPPYVSCLSINQIYLNYWN